MSTADSRRANATRSAVGVQAKESDAMEGVPPAEQWDPPATRVCVWVLGAKESARCREESPRNVWSGRCRWSGFGASCRCSPLPSSRRWRGSWSSTFENALQISEEAPHIVRRRDGVLLLPRDQPRHRASAGGRVFEHEQQSRGAKSRDREARSFRFEIEELERRFNLEVDLGLAAGHAGAFQGIHRFLGPHCPRNGRGCNYP